MALALHMDKRGVCWPSVTTLERLTGYSRRQVLRHLKAAEGSGWLTIERGGGPSRQGGPVNLYRTILKSGDAHVTTSPERAESEVVTSGTEVVTPMTRSGDAHVTQKDHEDQVVRTPQVRAAPRGGAAPGTREERIALSRLVGAMIEGDSERIEGAYLQDAAHFPFDLEAAHWIAGRLIHAPEGTEFGDWPIHGRGQFVERALLEWRKKGRQKWTREVFLSFLASAFFHKQGKVEGRPDLRVNGQPSFESGALWAFVDPASWPEPGGPTGSG